MASSDNLSDWNTWNRVEILLHRAQVEKGEIPTLGAIPTVTALKGCFPPRPSKEKKQATTFQESQGEGKETWEKKDVQAQSEPTPKLPNQPSQHSSQVEFKPGPKFLSHPSQHSLLYPPLGPIDSTPWPSKGPLPDSHTNPFHTPSAPPPYCVRSTSGREVARSSQSLSCKC